MDALPSIALSIAAIAASATCALVPLVKLLAWRCKAVAQPDQVRRLHRSPTPLWGGVAVFFGTAISLLTAQILHPTIGNSFLLPLGLATGMLCLVGMCDDLHSLSARPKLACQSGIALLIVLSGFYPRGIMLFGQNFDLGWLGAVCMIGWLVLGINALNLIDGMDGLASVTGIVVSVAIAAISCVHGNYPVLVVAIALAGGLLGFLVYNRPPATVFLGDSGSTLLGLALAFLAFEASSDASSTTQVSTLILLLFVPLVDTLLAIVRRLLMGRHIFHGDRSHLHHQLLSRGFGVWKTLGLLSAFCALSVGAACLAAINHAELIAWVIVLACTSALFTAGYIGGQERVLLRGVLEKALRRPGVESAGSGSFPHRDILPLQPGATGIISRMDEAGANQEPTEPSEERRVA